MPTYDYQCESCRHRFEVRQSFHDVPGASCPVCEGAARRRISLVPVIFKGSGWYVTDYAKRSSVTNGHASNDGKKDGLKDTKVENNGETAKADKPTSKKEPADSGKKAT